MVENRIVFVGNMNNMGYICAKELKHRGYDVTLILDVERNHPIDSPVLWDKELSSGYPTWIRSMPLKGKFPTFKFAFPETFLVEYISLINSYDIIFLNGHWISIGAFVKKDKIVIDLFAGYDLDMLANYKMVDKLTDSFYSTPIKKMFPRFLVNYFYRRLIKFQVKGIQKANMLNYYPTGINTDSDKLLAGIMEGRQFDRLELRGVETEKFSYVPPDTGREKFVILNITRFFFLNTRHDNKRNDIMIKGIGAFLKMNNIKEGVEIILFEKGNDVDEAKRLCDEYGLSPFVKWQKEVTVEELKTFFAFCDVAFDQLGGQWLGSGLYSMLTGRPLIANGRPEIFESITGEPSPVLQATNEDQVEQGLSKLYNDRSLVESIGLKSREYVMKHYAIDKTMDFFVDRFSKYSG